MKNQTIFELYTDDNKSKYSSNPKDILKSAKKNYGTLHQVNIHSCYYWICLQIPNRKKISNKHFNLCESEISLDETIKSINSVTNNKPPGNDGLTAEFINTFQMN